MLALTEALKEGQGYISTSQHAASVIVEAYAKAWHETCISLSLQNLTPNKAILSFGPLLVLLLRSSLPPTSNFPNCSSPREMASVFANYLRSHFLSLNQKPCVAKPEATCLRSAGPRAQKSLFFFLLSTHLHWISCGCSPSLIFHRYWCRQSYLITN